MILEEQLYLPIYLGRDIQAFSKTNWRPSFYSKEDYSQVENIQTVAKSSQGWMSNSPQGQTVHCSEKLQNTQELHQLASVNMLNF